MLILFLFFFIVLSLSQDCAELFPEADATSTYGDSCLVLNNDCMDWLEAEETCESMGGTLAIIKSQEDQNAVYNLQRVGGYEHYYLGATDEEEEGVWVWVDGTIIDEETDYVNWYPGIGNDNYQGIQHWMVTMGNGMWDDLGPNDCVSTPGYGNGNMGYICSIPTCTNYDGEYIAGYAQCGFDETHFRGDYEHIDSIDEILENLENQFIDEANYQLELLNAAFSDKESAHTTAVSSENAYQTAMQARVAAESTYNTARIAEEDAHSALLNAVSVFESAVEAYGAQYSTYSEQIEFLNYELYIIHEIRELLGDSLDYVPVQTVLEQTEYDETYENYANAYPTLLSSSYNSHRFGSDDEDRTPKKKRRRRGAKKRTTKRKTKKRTSQKKNKKRARKRSRV